MSANAKKVLEPGVKEVGPQTPGFHDFACRICGTSINDHQVPQLVSCLREWRNRMELMRLMNEVAGNVQQARAELAMLRQARPTLKLDDRVAPQPAPQPPTLVKGEKKRKK